MNLEKRPSNASFDNVASSASTAIETFGGEPNKPLATIGIILGSGLSAFAELLEKQPGSKKISYGDLPYFPRSSVAGHPGTLLYSQIEGIKVLVMEGRIHGYEGYSPSEVAFPVRVLSLLGVKTFVLTNASGGIGHDLNPGDLMLIKDHFNFTGANPLVGTNDSRLGPRFLDMTDTYSSELRDIAHKVSKQLDIKLKEGIYSGVLGPSYETPAEINMLKVLGSDAVGMSTVYETIVARHQGASVLGISCITNKAAGLGEAKLNHEDVQKVAKLASQKFSSLLMNLVPAIASNSHIKSKS